MENSVREIASGPMRRTKANVVALANSSVVSSVRYARQPELDAVIAAPRRKWVRVLPNIDDSLIPISDDPDDLAACDAAEAEAEANGWRGIPWEELAAELGLR